MLGYLRVDRGQRFASTTAVAPMTETFIRSIEQFVVSENIDLITFEKAAQGRRHARVLAKVQEERGRDVCWQDAGEGSHHADPAPSL